MSRLPVAALVAREAFATLRSAAWPLARLRPLAPAAASSQRPSVVLVHGYLGHAEMFRPLARRLHQGGWGRVARVRYRSTRCAMEQIVRHIDDAVAPLATSGKVDLVGHSLGAVACRAYLKLFGGDAHVRKFVSLGGPHAGTGLFRLTPPHLWEILDPEGPWVKRLSEGPEPVPTVVIRARYDHQVLPPCRACLEGADEIVLDGHGHNGLLWARAAHDAVVKALER